MHYIQTLIAQGEHQQLDFKFEISNAMKIAKTFSAFANTDGGKLLVGVKDNGVIAGVRSDEEYYMVEAAAQMYCKPEVNFSVKQWVVNTKTVLEVYIPKSISEPCLAKNEQGKWLAYIRVLDQNYLANLIWIKVWRRRMQPKGTYIRYTEKEKILFDYLAIHEKISFSALCKLAAVNKKIAEIMLVNLIALNLLEIEFTGVSAYYMAKKDLDL